MLCQTAIVVFADNPLVDARRKRLLSHGSRADNVRLMVALKKRTVAAATDTGFPVVVVDHKLQVGKTFAERIHNAYESVFAMGFNKVVLIGTDGTANADILHSATQRFHASTHSSAVAKDLRGGAWLIALTKAEFENVDLSALAWQTSQVYADLTTAFNNTDELEVELPDLNHNADVLHAVKLNSATTSFRHISSLLISFLIISFQRVVSDFRNVYDFLYNKGLRAPPTLS